MMLGLVTKIILKPTSKQLWTPQHKYIWTYGTNQKCEPSWVHDEPLFSCSVSVVFKLFLSPELFNLFKSVLYARPDCWVHFFCCCVAYCFFFHTCFTHALSQQDLNVISSHQKLFVPSANNHAAPTWLVQITKIKVLLCWINAVLWLVENS